MEYESYEKFLLFRCKLTIGVNFIEAFINKNGFVKRNDNLGFFSPANHDIKNPMPL